MDNPYYEKLVTCALRFVSYRPRSEKELKDFLAKKLFVWKVSEAVLVQRVVERMRELGYVDDQKFATWWVEQRASFRPKGKRAIAYELRKKGVTIDIALDEFELAKKAIAKNPKNVSFFLSSRGFSSDTIRRVIDWLAKKD